MNSPITYYGGKSITDNDIKREIKTIEEGSSNEFPDSILRIKEAIKCKFKDREEYISLKEDVGSAGGEGGVFKTNINGLVAKIYWPKMRTNIRKEKIEFMVNNQIEDAGICWPKGILTVDDNFIGFVMPYIDNNKYEIVDITFGHNDLADFFNHNKKNVIKLLINVMEIFEKLKNNNIVMGDINFNNFLIDKNTYKVVLIDLDGAQVDKFPCVTCKEYFNAPELLKGIDNTELNEEHIANCYYHKVYSTFLRDNYSLAVYSFMMLMCVKPYNSKICLANNDFGYDLTSKDKTLSNGKAEAYSNRWSHLPFFIREAFVKCFTTKNPNERLTPTQWKKLFSYYLKILEDGVLKDLDSDCEDVYPRNGINYNNLKNLTYILEMDINSSGFTIKNTIKKIIKELEINRINHNIDIEIVSEYLKHQRLLKIGNFKFELLYNIGVLSKVALRYADN